MKPEEQRIAIAEACGLRMDRPISGWHDLGCDCRECYPLPNYTRDLNAAMKAVDKLIAGDIGQDLIARHRMFIYTRCLMRLTSGDRYAPDWPDVTAYSPFGVLLLVKNISAPHVCEALLRTLNLWKDDN